MVGILQTAGDNTRKLAHMDKDKLLKSRIDFLYLFVVVLIVLLLAGNWLMKKMLLQTAIILLLLDKFNFVIKTFYLYIYSTLLKIIHVLGLHVGLYV